MSEILIKADIRAIRLWLVSVGNDENMPDRDRWLAKQTLETLNKALGVLPMAAK